MCACYLLSRGWCPGKGEGRKAETSRGGWRPSGLGLWSYLEQTLFHMPTHFLLCPCQRSAAQWTYLSILRLPALHLSNPGCSKGKENTDIKIKTSKTCTILTLNYILNYSANRYTTVQASVTFLFKLQHLHKDMYNRRPQVLDTIKPI